MIDIPNYDNWKLSCGLEGEKVRSECRQCGGEIYEGEDYFVIDGEDLHDDCVEAYAKENIAERITSVV